MLPALSPRYGEGPKDCFNLGTKLDQSISAVSSLKRTLNSATLPSALSFLSLRSNCRSKWKGLF